jgi:F-type H+-transporting ATPase subunit c
MKKWMTMVPAITAALLMAPAAYAQDGGGGGNGLAFVGVGLLMGLGVMGGGVGQGNAIKGALEGTSRNPGASGQIFVQMLTGLAFVESLVIFGLIIAYMLQGKIH